MGYETARSLISVTENNTQKQTNSNIEYKVVTCNGLEIKLPKDEKSYSSPHFVGVIEDLFTDGQTECVRYYDNDFHHDMKIISELNPNILFGINVLVSESNEYYLNGKILVDKGHWAYTYKDSHDVLAVDPESKAWRKIVKQWA